MIANEETVVYQITSGPIDSLFAVYEISPKGIRGLLYKWRLLNIDELLEEFYIKPEDVMKYPIVRKKK